jgi:hypothetical protein
MSELCRANHMDFIVAVIPTKEMVFSQYLEHNRNIALNDVIDRLIQNERIARERTFDFLRSSHIAYADPLPALQGAISQQLYARTASDMHPSKNGYQIVAKVISAAMQPSKARKTAASLGNRHY